jgi:hypothetical protein
MDNSNSVSDPVLSRQTLKLKAGARKPPKERKATSKAASMSPPQSQSKLKSGAHWSDEYRQRMQEDMDLLTSR